MLVMTKFDLLDEAESAAVNDNIFFYHPSSYGFHGDVFSPDVSSLKFDMPTTMSLF